MARVWLGLQSNANSEKKNKSFCPLFGFGWLKTVKWNYLTSFTFLGLVSHSSIAQRTSSRIMS